MTKELEITKEMIKFLEANGAETVAEYSLWMAHSAQALIYLGGLVLFMSVASFIMSFFSHDKVPGVIAGTILLGLGAAIIATNYPTLMEPKAYAMHQLITDVRG